ncbi:TonB-dependent receptor plug domain-containing protein [Pelagicoccus sp. SDUM812005]|uniref:TonB-dependent siderophore receptor n=1 Tax=Pelagicoccus sp. SDUM812005 TaxID=3041257 RepID=UPI00280F9951|nr:TonB-dependent receptor plug domain-containing protein [Pelagicoccus sp. SDUM812005]MDQ8181627.1 hypothetical protein [Pelagicoccus sp. SDUM812005]
MLYPLLAVFAAAPFAAFAQDTAEADEDIFELSPFEVVADQDEGYRAANTLSGSRLNSALKDVPSVVDVSTKELLDDLAVTNFQELMEYQGNTQVHDFEDTGATNSGTFNSSMPNERMTYRSRGFVGGNTRDFIPWNSPDDYYNINRIDFSKGPNGVLFGLGSTGGTANATSKRAVTHRDFVNLELQYGSWDHKRGTVDFNKSIVDDRFGLRVNLVEQDSGGYRNFSFRDVSRQALSGTWKIAKRTTFRANYEQGEQKVSSHRPFGPSDQFSEWIGEGGVAPTYAGNGRANNNTGSGIQTRGGNTAWVVMDGGNTHNLVYSPRSTVYNDARNADPYRHNFAGRFLTPDVETFGEYAISDKVAFEGPDSWNEAEWDQKLLTLEHGFSEKLNMELTYYQEDMTTYGQNPGGSQVYVDLVEHYGNPLTWNPYQSANLLPDGENSHYGDFYMENTWRTNENFRDLEGYRATVSYDLDLEEKFDGKLGQFLGRHRLAAMGESREEFLERLNTFEVLSSDSVIALESMVESDSNPDNDPSLSNPVGGGPSYLNNNAEHTRNRIIRRNYVSFGDWDDFHTGRFPSDMSVSVPMLDGSVQELSTTFVPTGQNAISSDIVKDDAWMVASQSFFFNNRLVTTVGYRNDDVSIDRAQSIRDTLANTGVVDYDGDGQTGEWVLRKDDEFRSQSDVHGVTRSFGAVFHATEHVSVFVNQSSGRRLPAVGQQIAPFGDLAPGEAGESIDYGITFDLFDRKVTGRINRFDSTGENVFIWNNAGANGSATRIMDGLIANGADISAEEYDLHTPTFNGSLGDVATEGYEMRLVGNPTKNLRFVFNYTYSRRNWDNVMVNTYDWMVDESAYYAEKLASIGMDMDSDLGTSYNVDGIARTSANDLVNVVLGRVIRGQFQKAVGFGERPHKVNLTGNYSIKDGRFKGLSFGGGFRWQDENIADAVIEFDDLNNNYNLDNNETAAMLADGRYPTLKEVLYGEDTLMTDLFLKYRFKNSWFGDGVDTDLQLNVKNVFNNTDVLTTGYINSFEGVQQYRFQEPRSYRVTMRMKF